MPDSVFTRCLGYSKSQAQQMGMVVARYQGQGNEVLVTEVLLGRMQDFWSWVEQWLPRIVIVLDTTVKEVVCYMYLTLKEELNLHGFSPHLAGILNHNSNKNNNNNNNTPLCR